MVRLVFSNESKTFAMKKKEKTENYSQSILLKREREVSADSFEHLRNYHSSLLTHCDSIIFVLQIDMFPFGKRSEDERAN